MMIRSMLIAIALAAAGPAALGQLNKCIGAGGEVSYSDRACPTSQKPAEVTAKPIAEPTRADAAAAEVRRQVLKIEAAELDRRRRAEIAANQAQARQFSLGSTSRGQPLKNASADHDRCRGVKSKIRAAKYMDPTGYDRNIETLELMRAEQRYCAP